MHLLFWVICPHDSILGKIYNERFCVCFFSLLKMTYSACLAGSELKIIFHWNLQLDTLLKSLFQFNDELCMFPTREKSEVSLANNFGLDVRLSAKSNHEEFLPFSTTCCFLLFRKSMLKFKNSPVIPFCFGLKRRLSSKELLLGMSSRFIVLEYYHALRGVFRILLNI